MDFFDKFEEDIEYAIHLPRTIAMHRFDSIHQDFSKPRILLRTCDEFGFTVGYAVNTGYRHLKSELDEMLGEINRNGYEEIAKAMKLLEDETYYQIYGLLAMDKMETDFCSKLKRLLPDKAYDIDRLPPILEKIYDERGIPKNSKLNSRVFEEINYAEDGIFKVTLSGFPISQEDINRTSIEDIIKRFYDSG